MALLSCFYVLFVVSINFLAQVKFNLHHYGEQEYMHFGVEESHLGTEMALTRHWIVSMVLNAQIKDIEQTADSTFLADNS